MFTDSFFKYQRRDTLSAYVGNVVIGSKYPIVIQSMCNTSTLDTESSVLQAKEIYDTGGELVRFTAQGIREAENLANIHAGLRSLGCDVPLVADIHFNPDAAMIAAENVEKVRINPGNFIDKRAVFANIEYSEYEYTQELSRLRDKLLLLLDKCKTFGTALRIGVNHGSLSDRIMSRYGDTPKGMVESAMEFIRICKEYDFNDVVVSMKSSNTQVMMRAYRLLTMAMNNEKISYPLHLGVTEAGDAEDGRIKSAVGIGALLNDGIGDTIRVSLTETPKNEIPVAKALAKYYTSRGNHTPIKEYPLDAYSPYEYQKRESFTVENIGGDNVPIVVVSIPCDTDELNNIEVKPDYTYIKRGFSSENSNIISEKDITDAENRDKDAKFIKLSLSNINDSLSDWLKDNPEKIIIAVTNNINGVAEHRALFLALLSNDIKNPVIIKRDYNLDSVELLGIHSGADFGMLFMDGFGDGIWIENNGSIPAKEISNIAFSILQASRVRVTKTEYISCPGCGRTLFSLQETLAKVKEATFSLTGLKIAVMGCIVNGPGEMADADYGYVGSGRGTITLYKGKVVIERGIKENEAVERLVELIKENGDWIVSDK